MKLRKKVTIISIAVALCLCMMATNASANTYWQYWTDGGGDHLPVVRGKFEASGYGPDQGFRVARNA